MPTLDPLLFVVVVAGLLSGLILTLALAAFARRKSLSYFLVTLALATLLSRSLLGAFVLEGLVTHSRHHLMEHGLDLLAVCLLFVAVYAARSTDARPDGPDEWAGGDDEWAGSREVTDDE